MTTPVEEMEEQTVIALTELLGSREEAIERYDEFVERQKLKTRYGKRLSTKGIENLSMML